MKQHAIIELPAGQRPDGSLVMEKVAVRYLEDGQVEMLHSPGFVKGVARGDLLTLGDNGFEVTVRAGLVAIQIYKRENIEQLEPSLTEQLKTLDGRRDIKTERVLAYSVPAESGFAAIEQVMNDLAKANDDVQWVYGNVYDADGEPLNWWMNEK
ncbi:hypothetical protein SIN8267_03258 [Sinobacterium norvegicum]|uniref:DUF4265 domain-containing protein n=1 Tax=Sinobacterium norvegicum TaxID=1641715 RepID=A0ABN8EL67_9GAMM|nr:DUF4265 domain-containing protein [Sinobacterium norvegicum]CAH0993119.1 hypothetical protein SIN8267_03258 [Sinobacterium norvegicum]